MLDIVCHFVIMFINWQVMLDKICHISENNSAYFSKVNLPPMSLASQGKTKFKAQQRARQQAKPVYLHSHKELE